MLTRYPEVLLEVTTEDCAVDLIEQGFDLVIRVNPKPDGSLVGRILLRDRLVVVAGPKLARPKGKASVAAVVRGAGDGAQAWSVTTKSAKSSIPIKPVLHLSSLVMVRDAVRAGIGVARLPISLVSHDLVKGTLNKWGMWKARTSRCGHSIRRGVF